MDLISLCQHPDSPCNALLTYFSQIFPQIGAFLGQAAFQDIAIFTFASTIMPLIK